MTTIVEIHAPALCRRMVSRGERVWIPCLVVAAPGTVCGRLEAPADRHPTRPVFEIEGDEPNRALPSSVNTCRCRRELHPTHGSRQGRLGVRAIDPRPNGARVLAFSAGAENKFSRARKRKRQVFEHLAFPNQLKSQFGRIDKAYSTANNRLARIIAMPCRVRQISEIEGDERNNPLPSAAKARPDRLQLHPRHESLIRHLCLGHHFLSPT